MSGLEDTFGEDFAEQVEQQTRKRREERQKIGEDDKAIISHLAINEQRMHDGEPQFSYTSDEGIHHDVLLMKLAEPREGSVWNQVTEFDNGGFSIPLEYLGEWYYSIFNDESMAKKMDEGEWYIVVGRLDTWEPDEGEPREQLSPVRGVISLDEAKEYADKMLEEEGFDQDEGDDMSGFSEDEDEDEEEEDEAPDTESIFGGGGDDEEEDDKPALEASYSDVANVVETLADDEEVIWDLHPDHEEWDDTFRAIIADRLGLEPSSSATDEALDLAYDRIEEGPGEEEEDDAEESLF